MIDTDESEDYLFKIVLAGFQCVGKTVFFNKYIKDIAAEDRKPTIGCDFSSKTIDIKGCKVKAYLWDTSGIKRFRSMIRTFYKGSDGCILVYDITSKESFKELEYICTDVLQ